MSSLPVAFGPFRSPPLAKSCSVNGTLQTDIEKPEIVIAHVVLVPFPAEFQSVVPDGLRNVIIELNLSDVTSLRPDKVVAGKPNAARTASTKARIAVRQRGRERRERRVQIRVLKDRRVPRGCEQELVGHSGAERVGPVQLPLIFRLVALSVENGLSGSV